MGQDLIRYDLLTQDAMRGVVRTALERAAVDGLPGEHHFFVTFSTAHPGVDMSDALRARYPDEMTIVLQHQFWDLEADEERFAVSLSFNGIPERLDVPYAALKSFFDPSVPFGMQFHPMDEAPAPRAAEAGGGGGRAIERAHHDGGGNSGPGEVVRLDAFRKKPNG